MPQKDLLQRMEIPALPVHDCVIVPREKGTTEQVKRVMLRVFRQFTGVGWMPMPCSRSSVRVSCSRMGSKWNEGS